MKSKKTKLFIIFFLMMVGIFWYSNYSYASTDSGTSEWYDGEQYVGKLTFSLSYNNGKVSVYVSLNPNNWESNGEYRKFYIKEAQLMINYSTKETKKPTNNTTNISFSSFDANEGDSILIGYSGKEVFRSKGRDEDSASVPGGSYSMSIPVSIVAPTMGTVYYGSSQNTSNWYTSASSVLDEYDDLSKVSTIYVKATASSSTSISDITASGLNRVSFSSGTSATAIFSASSNGSYTITANNGKTKTTTANVSGIDSYGTKTVKPPTVSVAYSIDNSDWTTGPEIKNKHDDLNILRTLYIKVTVGLGDGTITKNITSVTSSNVEHVSGSTSGSAPLTIVYKISGTTNKSWSVEAKIVGDGDKTKKDSHSATTNVMGKYGTKTVKPPTISIKYGSSKNASTWYSTEAGMLADYDELTEVKTIYIKASIGLGSGTVTKNISSVTSSGLTKESGTTSGVTSTDVIYSKTANSAWSITATVTGDDKSKTETKSDTMSNINNVGTQTVPYPSVTLGWALSSNASTWYPSEDALWKATEDIVDMTTIYIKATVTSSGTNSKNITSITSDGLTKSGTTTGTNTKSASAIFYSSSDVSTSIYATVTGDPGHTKTKTQNVSVTHAGDEGYIIVKPPEVTVSCSLNGGEYFDVVRITYGNQTKTPTVWNLSTKQARRRGKVTIKVSATDPRGIKEIIMDGSTSSKSGATSANSSKDYYATSTSFLTGTTVSYRANSSCSTKKYTSGSFKLSDYITQYVEVSGTMSVAPVSGFKPYLLDGKTVIKFVITYGEEFLDKSKLTILEQGTPGSETGINTVYKVNTQLTDTQATGLSYTLYYTNGTNTTTVPYTIAQNLAYANAYGKVFISDGNVSIDNTRTTFGALLGEEASTILGQKRVGGTSSDYTVSVNVTGGKTVILDELSITSSSKAPVSIAANSNLILQTNNNLDTTLNINSASNTHAAVELGNNASITLKKEQNKNCKLNITHSGTGAGIGGSQSSNISGTNIVVDGAILDITMSNSAGGAGIGSGYGGSIGTITVNSGTISVSAIKGAGIGSGVKLNSTEGSCGAISITGGTITATNKVGAGIGTGCEGRVNGNINISGGTITVTKNGSGAVGDLTSGDGGGIGTGAYGTVSGNINITGGTITTTTGSGSGIGGGYQGTITGTIGISGQAKLDLTAGGGAGIGAGYRGTSGAITINLDTSDTSKYYIKTKCTDGAGIGSGKGGTCGNITINGGKITTENVADSTQNWVGGGAGIGSGTKYESSTQASCGTITISPASGKSILITTTNIDGAGIGSGNGSSCGAISISGGTIKPKVTGGAAGIGSGKSGSISGTITISDGTIEPQTTSDNMTTSGAGIGSGESGSVSGTITISGGTIKPKVSSGGAGIGSGKSGSCTSITVSNGTVTATITGAGAGIGSGESGSATGTITVSGGTVTTTSTSGAGIGSGKSGSVTETITISPASGKTISITTNTTSGAGVGSGENGSASGKITISGGTVITTSTNGAGVGSGEKSGSTGGSCGAIEITGGTVTPTAGNGAGIGSGNGGSCGAISISSGTITPTSTNGAGIGSGNGGSCGAIEISGGTIKPKVTSGAGIGSGNGGTMGNITISAGTITYQTSGTTNYAISQTGAAIGSGYNSYNGNNTTSPTITITGGSFTIRVGDTNSNTNEGAGAGIGSGKNGGIKSISISNVASINIQAWGGAGIGSGYTGTSGDITINNVGATSGTIEIKDKGGAGIGSGKEGVCGNIDVDNSTLTITTTQGAGIGSGKDGLCGTIDINNNNKTITITTQSGAGVGSGKKEDATESVCGSITISNAVVKITINKAGVGIGSASNATSGNIAINNSQVKVEGATNSGALVGIGSASSSASEDITLTATKAKISGVKVGIGSSSSSKVGNITIQKNASGTSYTTTPIINISVSDVGMGTANNGTVGNITIKDSNLEVNSSAGEGIGCGPSASMGNISISNSNAKVNAYKTGIGSDSGYVAGNITITASNIQSDSTNSSSYTGIGAGGSAIIGDITIKGTSTSTPYNMAVKTTSNGGTGIGCGGTGIVGKILLQYAKVGVSSCSVGIGCGSSGTIGKDTTDNYNIKISSCNPVQISATVVGIGKYAGTNTTVGNIAIGDSAIQISGVTNSNGVGIGSTNGNLNGININGSTINVATTGTGSSGAAIGGSLSNNQDIVISYSKVITSTNKGVGIGGKGTNLDIDISNSKLNVTTGGGTGIGTNEDTIKDITITSCIGSVLGNGAGAGIGSGAGTVGTITISNSEVAAINGSATTGAGIGSGQNGTVANIVIEGSKVVAEGSNGAGIGSGQNGKVTGKIQIKDGTIITKGSTGAAIGGGNGSSSSVGTIEIDNGKVYATADSGGAGIGSGQSGTIVNITIKNSDITSKVTSTGAGIGSGQGGSLTGKIEIDVGTSLPVSNIDVVTTSGSAIGKGSSGSADEIKIGNGIIEAVSGTESIKTPAISATTITILDGVERFCNRGGGADLEGRGYIALDANVKLYNGTASGTITREGSDAEVSCKRLTSPMLRNQEGTATIKYGNKTATVKTDSNGDICAWLLDDETVEVEINGLTFTIA